MRTDDLICMMAKTPPCSCTKRNARIWLRIAALFAVYLGIVAGVMGLRPDLALMRHDPLMTFKYACLAAVMVGSGIAWWYSGHPGRSYRISYYGLMVLSVLVVGMTGYAMSWDSPDVIVASVFNHTAFFCVGFIAVFAVIGSFILTKITQCMAPTHCRLHAFMTGLFAASLGGFAYAMHCPQDHPAYLALWYGGTMIAFTLLALPVIMKKQAW